MTIDRRDFDALARYDIVVGMPYSLNGIKPKARPLLVLSSPSFHYTTSHVIVALMTASDTSRRHFQDLVTSWQEAGLTRPGSISFTFQTLMMRSVSRKIGRLQSEDIAVFEGNWREIMGEGA